MIPKPGIYYGVPFAEYLTWRCASKTTLARMRRSPLHANTQIEPTEAMDAGTMAHTLILEPTAFSDRFSIGPCDDRRLKAWKEWESTGPSGIMVKPCDVDAAKAAQAAVLRKPVLSKLLSLVTATEVSFVWHDAETGVLCKGRADALIDSLGLVIDLKFTADATEQAFTRSAANLGYHFGSVLYQDGLRANGWPCRGFVHLCLEKSAPYECAAYQLDDRWHEIAQAELPPLLRAWNECNTTGVWPGYPDAIIDVAPPAWLAMPIPEAI